MAKALNGAGVWWRAIILPACHIVRVTKMQNGRVLSFIDLRRFAREAMATLTAGGYLEARVALDLAPGPVSVAALSIAPGGGVVAGLDGDEFIILLQGDLTLCDNTSNITLAPDASAVIPRGRKFQYSSTAGAKALVMHCAEPGGPGADRLITIEHDVMLEPSSAPLAELLLSPTPACRNHTAYKSASGTFMCGVWDSTPYHRRAMPYRHYELMHLLAGSVSFVDGAGQEGTFHQGAVFLVEQGAECSWESREHVAKVYAIYRPA
jgi:uncharacterized cupin superfamily protein